MKKSMIDFNAIDVETANEDRASICQIGIVQVRNGEITNEWKTFVNPEDYFDGWNIDIHGISEADVKDSPTLPDIRDKLSQLLRGLVLVSHTSFDRVAFERAMDKYGLEQLQVTWLDSAKIARRAWPDKFAVRGYGLKKIAKTFGMDFRHHDALEDAKTAGKIVLRACAESALDIDDWLNRVQQPIDLINKSNKNKPCRLDGRPDGPLQGETIVFTGALSIPRNQAADLAADAGCNVLSAVNKTVTMLVTGMQDIRKLNGHEKSSKHRKIKAMIDRGDEVQILSENDFLALLKAL